ncbi:MAG: 2-hydroxyacid dehydrogenase [Candidatus Dormibacteria bacterium]
MDPSVLGTLPLPRPFGQLVEPVAGLRNLGHVPTTEELILELSAHPVDVLCPQMADRIDERVLSAAAPRLRAVCVYAAGFDNIDLEAAGRRNVIVGNTAGALTDATADCAMGLMLAAGRRLCEGDAEMRRGAFAGWAPDHLLGVDLSHGLLGIIGFGRIGQAVARRALGFSMRVVYAQREGVVVAEDLRDRVSAVPLESLLEEADVLSLHVPLTSATRHLLDEPALRRMKPTSILVNTSRGAVVDEPVLVRALREGWIAGAGLDVYENEPRLAPGLAECRNAVLAPHVGSATPRTRSAMAELCAGNTIDALAGRPPRSCVNPAAWSVPPPPLIPTTSG